MKKLTILIIPTLLLIISCGGGSGTETITDINEKTNLESTLSSDTSLISSIGIVDNLSIIDIPFETTLDDFSAAITISNDSTFEIYETDGISIANDLKSSYRVKVTAEDNSSETYTIQTLPDPRLLGSWEEFDTESEDYEIVGAEITEGMEEGSSGLSFSGDPEDMNYLLIPYSEEYDLRDNGTMEIVVKARSIKEYAGLISKSQDADFSDEAYGLQLYRYENSHARLLFFVYDDSGSWIGINGTFDIQVETWYHIVATWDSENMYLYVNGVLDGTRENTTGGVRQTDAGVTIGGQLTDKYNDTYGNFGWDGVIDSASIMKETMSAEEVLERYNNL